MTDETLDREIREAVEPSPAAVTRVLATSLGPSPRRAPALGPWLAVATLVLVLLAAFITVRRESPPVAAARVRITNVGDTIVVQRPEGGVWLIGRGTSKPDGLAAGTVIAYRTGGQ